MGTHQADQAQPEHPLRPRSTSRVATSRPPVRAVTEQRCRWSPLQVSPSRDELREKGDNYRGPRPEEDSRPTDR